GGRRVRGRTCFRRARPHTVAPQHTTGHGATTVLELHHLAEPHLLGVGGGSSDSFLHYRRPADAPHDGRRTRRPPARAPSRALRRPRPARPSSGLTRSTVASPIRPLPGTAQIRDRSATLLS